MVSGYAGAAGAKHTDRTNNQGEETQTARPIKTLLNGSKNNKSGAQHSCSPLNTRPAFIVIPLVILYLRSL